VEQTEDGERRTTEAADKNRGVPQGGPRSPRLANLYFRRFVRAWKRFGHERRREAHVVNEADDLVIGCRPGKGQQAMEVFRWLRTRLGLTVHERKTRWGKLPGESFDFLGYPSGRFYGKDGRFYLGTRPSQKAVHKLLLRIHEETSCRWKGQSPQERIAEVNPILRGGCGDCNQGPGASLDRMLRQDTERRFRRGLRRRQPRQGTGYKQDPDAYLYETRGLSELPPSRRAVLNAKA